MKIPTDSTLSENAIQRLEALIPVLAALATRAASTRALASGRTVLKVEGSNILAVTAEGASLVVGEVKPRRKVPVGQAITVRRLSA